MGNTFPSAELPRSQPGMENKRAAVTQRGASVSSSRAGESQPSAVSWELEEEEEGRSRTPASTQMLC